MSENNKINRLSLEETKSVVKGLLSAIEGGQVTKNPLMEGLNSIEDAEVSAIVEKELPMYVIFPDGGRMDFKFISTASKSRTESLEEIRSSIEFKTPTPKGNYWYLK